MGWGTPRSGTVPTAGNVPSSKAEGSQAALVMLWKALGCGQVLVGQRAMRFPVLHLHLAGALQTRKHLLDHLTTAN